MPCNTEQPQVNDDGVNPDHYPLGDLPLMDEVAFLCIVDDPRPTQDQVDALRENLERQDRKIKWLRDRPDRDAREASAMGAVRVASICQLGALAKDGAKAKINQRERAKKPRRRVSDDGKTISGVIGRMALSREHEEESANELWPRFYGELDHLKLNPSEVNYPTDPKKSAYEYDDAKGERRSISFGQFANVVSDYRTGGKSG